MPTYPLKFKPLLFEKVWGGSSLEDRFGKKTDLPGTAPIGESWELADLPEAESVITNGPYAGRTLRQLIQKNESAILGDLAPTPAGRFPLLLKFLDAREPLSVQVHPPAEYLEKQADKSAVPKHEAWYIIDAEPDAVIYRGLRPGVTPDQFRQHINDGTAHDDLVEHPATPGRCYYIPAGTVHAIGAGVFLAEVQLPSDTTYRLYDWGRTERTLHLEEGLAAMSFDAPDVRLIEERSHIAGIFSTVSKICDSPYFRIEKIRMTEGFGQELTYRQPAAWMVLEGEATISGTPASVDVEIVAGDVLLIPAGMTEAQIDFRADTTWLEIQLPTSLENVRLA